MAVTLSYVSEFLSMARHFPSGGILSDWQNGADPVAIPSATAEEIHGKVDALSGQLVEAAERVLEYKRLYPGNAFLTRDQVRDVCRRYNLVFAPEFLFDGKVPEKNQAELAAFRLHESHREFRLGWNETISALAMGNIDRSSVSSDIIEMLAMSIPPGDFSAPFLLPFGTRFAIWSPKGFGQVIEYMLAECRRPQIHRLFERPDYKVVIQADSGFVFVDPEWVRPITLSYEPGFGAATNWTLRISVHLGLIGRYRREDMARMVICPASMLRANLPITTRDGWEIQFGGNRMPFGNGFDPIVLQPVEGGYLVITKWDAEALIPEVAGQNN